MKLVSPLLTLLLPMMAWSKKVKLSMLDGVDTWATNEQESPACSSGATARLEMEFIQGLSYADFELSVYNGVGITQAHLHCGMAGTNGPVVAFLYGPQPGVDVDGELTYGQLTNENFIDFDDGAGACGVTINNIASLYEAILHRKIYVNVHSEGCPAGDMRGQLMSLYK